MKSLLVLCYMWQKGRVVLHRMGHEHHIHVFEGPLLHQVYFTPGVFLSRGPQHCHLWRESVFMFSISEAPWWWDPV